MKLKLLTPEGWLLQRRSIYQFAIRYSDRRATVSTLNALRRLDSALLIRDSSDNYHAAAVIATNNQRLAGIGFARNGPSENCLIIVHPEERRHGIGHALMEKMMQRLGGLTCHVATDNTASLALCFSLGMNAVSMHQGPTGKPTLRFERKLNNDTASSWDSNIIS